MKMDLPYDEFNFAKDRILFFKLMIIFFNKDQLYLSMGPERCHKFKVQSFTIISVFNL